MHIVRDFALTVQPYYSLEDKREVLIPGIVSRTNFKGKVEITFEQKLTQNRKI